MTNELGITVLLQGSPVSLEGPLNSTVGPRVTPHDRFSGN